MKTDHPNFATIWLGLRRLHDIAATWKLLLNNRQICS
jgi:hypothetical protein